MSQTYRVSWEIDIDATTPREAAEKALEIQRRVGSSAVVFECLDESGDSHRVDLDEDPAEYTAADKLDEIRSLDKLR